MQATFEAGWQDSSSCLMRHQAHGNLATGPDENSSVIEARQLANQNLTRELLEANNALGKSQFANQELRAELAELNEKLSAAGPSTPREFVSCSLTLSTARVFQCYHQSRCAGQSHDRNLRDLRNPYNSGYPSQNL